MYEMYNLHEWKGKIQSLIMCTQFRETKKWSNLVVPQKIKGDSDLELGAGGGTSIWKFLKKIQIIMHELHKEKSKSTNHNSTDYQILLLQLKWDPYEKLIKRHNESTNNE